MIHTMLRWTWLGSLAVGVGLLALPVEASLIAQYDFEGNANDSVNSFHGTINGSPTFVPSPVGGQALSLSGTGNYIATTATASQLGIGGGNPKTISVWARPLAFNDGGIWDLGLAGSSGENFALRTLSSGNNAWRSQFWGGDLDFTAPNSLNNWGYYVLTYDGTTARAYYNGILMGTLSRTLATNDNRPLEIGRWTNATPTSYYFQGQIDKLRVYNETLTDAQIAAQFRADGGFLVDFEDTGGRLPADWYVSGGSGSIRLRTSGAHDTNPDGQYSLLTSGGTGMPDVTLNVYNSHHDYNTSMAWGPIFQVQNGQAVINFKIAGGSYTLNSNSQRNGGTGVALWDIAANDFVPGSFRTRSSSAATYEWTSIPLEGLEGRWLALVVVDRQVSSWGWTGVDSINAPAGAVSVLDPSMHHRVLLSYDFDTPGDFMGWYQVDSLGNQVPITSFQVGQCGTSLINRHISLDGTFSLGKGFLSSTTSSNTETPTGILRSPDFVITGDIIEFYISGGSTSDMAFELVRSSDNVVLRSAVHETDANEFDYMFWRIKDLAGTTAYLRLRDERSSGGWGHLEIDAIRMVAFAVPEPATGTLAVLSGLGLLVLARRKLSRREKIC